MTNSRGFTLIEVLVALVIVAIALGAGIKAAGALGNNAERLAQVSAAQWCAENLLTELRLNQQSQNQLPNIGESPFSCEQLGRSYAGTLNVSPTPNPNFRRIDAAVAQRAVSQRRSSRRGRCGSSERQRNRAG